MLRLRGFATAVLAVTLLTACADTPLPGTLLGTYKVVAQAQSNTCGMAGPNPWTFDVQVSEDGQRFYWSWLDGTPPLSAFMTSSTAISLLATQQANVDTTADGGMGPCVLERDDTVAVTLGSGSPPGSFTGTVGYDFSVPVGSICTDQLAAAGGAYTELPCTMTYSMTATRQ